MPARIPVAEQQQRFHDSPKRGTCVVRKPKNVEQKKAHVEQKKAHDLLEMIQGLRQLIDRLEAELFDVYKKVKNSKSFFSLQLIMYRPRLSAARNAECVKS